MSNRAEELFLMDDQTAKKAVTVLNLEGFLALREKEFPPKVVEDLRLQFPAMASGLEALMNTVELFLFLHELPVSVVKENIIPHPFFPKGEIVKVHTPDTVYVGHDVLFVLLQAVNLDKAWTALREATAHMTKQPDAPVDIAKAYGLPERKEGT